MYEEYYLPLKNPEMYLNKLGFSSSDVEISPDFLSKLVKAHLYNINFSNIEVWDKGVCPSITPEDLFEKIVVNGWGGYCFELNNLFNALLNTIGFKSQIVLASVVGRSPEARVPSHCACIVTIDGEKYFADVGYGGDLPEGALKLPDGTFSDWSGNWHMEKAEEENYYYLCKGDSKVIICRDFNFDKQDFIPLNYYISQMPQSPFRFMIMVNRRIREGVIYSVSNEFFKKHGTDEADRKLSSTEELRELLIKEFGFSEKLSITKALPVTPKEFL